MPKREGAKKALVSRVKKAVKKSRRKLGAEKFEKELTRTITFLADLQSKLTVTPKAPRTANGKPGGKAGDKTAAKASAKPRRKPAAKRVPPVKPPKPAATAKRGK